MKAIVVDKNLSEGFGTVEKGGLKISRGHAIVKINAVSLNRRDYWCTIGKYPGIKNGVTLGSDACGEVTEVGCDEGLSWLNKKVIINPVVKAFDNPIMPSLNYRLLGTPYDGTLTEYIMVEYNRLAIKPDHLDNNQASCFPLAGLTAYNAVFSKAVLKKNQRVLITGIGGGVAQFAAQFAKTIGAVVNVTTGSEVKRELAEKKGYKAFNYNDTNFATICSEKDDYFDSIIDGTGGDQYVMLLRKLKINGSLVSYGATAGQNVQINLPSLFFGQYKILGCTMGTDQDFKNMIDFVNENKLVPEINSVYKFSNYKEAFKELADGNQFGKIVISMEDHL